AQPPARRGGGAPGPALAPRPRPAAPLRAGRARPPRRRPRSRAEGGAAGAASARPAPGLPGHLPLPQCRAHPGAAAVRCGRAPAHRGAARRARRLRAGPRLGVVPGGRGRRGARLPAAAAPVV
ncbi:MAG: hypothetical protein AVDCRST_MAG68-3679, partial [uncultured Gemmatimonadetes bacterium]